MPEGRSQEATLAAAIAGAPHRQPKHLTTQITNVVARAAIALVGLHGAVSKSPASC